MKRQAISDFAVMLGVKKLSYAEIEPAIKPVVDALNAIPGIGTIASCQGHAFRGRSIGDLLFGGGCAPLSISKSPYLWRPSLRVLCTNPT